MPSQAATLLCFGKPATMVGTSGDDTLIGQGGVSDVVYGGGGNDYTSGGDFFGDDAIPGHAPDLPDSRTAVRVDHDSVSTVEHVTRVTKPTS